LMSCHGFWLFIQVEVDLVGGDWASRNYLAFLSKIDTYRLVHWRFSSRTDFQLNFYDHLCCIMDFHWSICVCRVIVRFCWSKSLLLSFFDFARTFPLCFVNRPLPHGFNSL
jgi:hypothetical protein